MPEGYNATVTITPPPESGWVVAWGEAAARIADGETSLHPHDTPESGVRWFDTEDEAIAFVAECMRKDTERQASLN